ncbi:hypothetical protein CDAR_428171 [Caerostris darwini]|uniref:Uncharacterized protein n=1 Tax=Caerostris darwini TaxID=1538125 RepID=A0AAV4WIC0_9ARAC|nr:hypothetical protein CDAR_428171 [Caerostris darwini]
MRKKKLGPDNPDTLQIKASIASTRYDQNKSFEFYDVIERVFRKQKRSLNPNHEYILLNEVRLGHILFCENRLVSALRLFLTLEKKTAFLGSKHFFVKKCLKYIDRISTVFKNKGNESLFEKLKNDFGQLSGNKKNSFAGRSNNVEMDESNSLQEVVAKGEMENLKMLLERGADALQVFEGGNAALHVAAARGHRRCLNAPLPRPPSSHGTSYDTKNEANRTPLDLCQVEEIRSLLETVADLFNSVRKGKRDDIVGKIESLDSEDALAATRARNSSGKTLLQVAL